MMATRQRADDMNDLKFDSDKKYLVFLSLLSVTSLALFGHVTKVTCVTALFPVFITYILFIMRPKGTQKSEIGIKFVIIV